MPGRPLGAATGIPKDRTKSSDSGGSSAVRRPPDSRMRSSKSIPVGSAFVIPEMSTTSSFPARIDCAVFQACSRFCTWFPTSSPRSTNRNRVGLSCWYTSIGVQRFSRFASLVPKNSRRWGFAIAPRPYKSSRPSECHLHAGSWFPSRDLATGSAGDNREVQRPRTGWADRLHKIRDVDANGEQTNAFGSQPAQ
jgi:hypothetical protein